MRSLDEGIDVPEASLAVIAAGSRSKRQRIQRLGRILRRSGDKEAIAISILVRDTPEESKVGSRDEDLIGSSRAFHHRWPGRTVEEAISAPSSYSPVCDAETLEDRVTAAALEIEATVAAGSIQLGLPADHTATAATRRGGYVAARGSFSPNAWHPVDSVRPSAGMPAEDFDRLRSQIRVAYWGGLDPRFRTDETLIYGSEISAIQRRWDARRKRTSLF